MTEKRTAEAFLIEQSPKPDAGYSSSWVIGAMEAYAAQELADYKSKLKEELEKRSEEVDPIFQLCFMNIEQIIDKL